MSLKRTELARTGRVKPRSDKRADMDYQAFAIAELLAHPRCQVGPIIATIDPLWTGCTGRSQGLHHLRKRSSAGAITCQANTLASCNPCNAGWIEDQPKLAKAARLTVRPEHRERWEQLGARYHQEHHEGTA